MTVYKIEHNAADAFLVDFNLINDFKTTVRHQRLWNTYTLRSLVVLKERSYDAWESKG